MAENNKYGRLTIVSEPFRKFPLPTSKQKRTYVIAVCDCGKTIDAKLNELKSARIKSCGCLKSEMIRGGLHTTHGFANHPLCYTLNGIIQRCYNPKNPAYKNYGARGITICDEWMNDTSKFYDWALANGWEKGLQIDRKDNDGIYEPSNCRFVSSVTNNRNKRNIKLCEESVINIREIYQRGLANQTQIALIYGVGATNINAIVNNKTWAL